LPAALTATTGFSLPSENDSDDSSSGLESKLAVPAMWKLLVKLHSQAQSANQWREYALSLLHQQQQAPRNVIVGEVSSDRSSGVPIGDHEPKHPPQPHQQASLTTTTTTTSSDQSNNNTNTTNVSNIGGDESETSEKGQRLLLRLQKHERREQEEKHQEQKLLHLLNTHSAQRTEKPITANEPTEKVID